MRKPDESLEDIIARMNERIKREDSHPKQSVPKVDTVAAHGIEPPKTLERLFGKMKAKNILREAGKADYGHRRRLGEDY